MKLLEKEWFAAREPEIANARNAAARRKKIEALAKEDATLYTAFQENKRKSDGHSHFVRNSEGYPLCGRGDINTYTIFAELSRHILNELGRVGIIVPSGIATDDTTKFFSQDLIKTGTLACLYDFENAKGLFPGVGHGRFKFCLLTMTGVKRPVFGGAEFIFFAHYVSNLQEDHRRFKLSANDVSLLNPNTRTCPIFRSKKDAELTKTIYQKVPVFIKDGPPEHNQWGAKFMRMIDMSNDSHYFQTREQLTEDGRAISGNIFYKGKNVYLPLYEAKMFHHYNHRYGDYADYPEDALTSHLPDIPIERLQNPDYKVLPRYWVPKKEVTQRLFDHSFSWFIVFRDITNATNERTIIFGILPSVGVGNKAPLIVTECEPTKQACLVGCGGSFVFDYVARQSIGGTRPPFQKFLG